MTEVFTSITLNYLPKAKILAQTLKKFHPDWNFHLLISDRIPEGKRALFEAEFSQSYFDKVVWLEELEAPNLQGWIFKHTVVELCTAIKGLYLQKLASEGCEKVIYIDPDIAIFSSLEPLDDLLNQYAILLIPHLLDYSENPQSIHDNEIMGTLRHGTFNLGFLAINTMLPDGKRFIEWWGKRLWDYCYADYENGLFTDQKWCDLVPSYFENSRVIHDPGYDVASWNLDRRSVSFDPAGQLIVNGKYPLRFYHFTGYDSGAGFNVITELTAGGDNPIVRELWDWYLRELKENGQAQMGKTPCFYDYFDNGVKVEKEMRLTYRQMGQLQEVFSNPYDTQGGKGGFLAWWHKDRPKDSFKAKSKVNSTLTVTAPVQAGSAETRDSDGNAIQTRVFEDMLQSEKDGRDAAYVPLMGDSLDAADALVKLIAFYLPQYHPIPENDAWWGKGFTEWANVARAVPQFPGHYQPHLPGELGFYDLRVKEVQYRQIELAKQFGIYGFAYYYYWFSGKRLLEKPLDQMLSSKEMDFPFCLMWANENWTRRWDGLENDVLIAQNHSLEMDKEFIKDLVPYLRDDRYIRVNGRPLIMVYRADILPNPQQTMEIWREFCVQNSLGDPLLVAAQTFGFYDPRTTGFDGAVQFPPHNQLHDSRFMIQSRIELANPEFSSYIFSYPEIVKYKENHAENADYPLYKTVFPNWDSEPRKPGRGTIYAYSSPELYGRWLKTICEWTLKNHQPDDRLIFINAWNEWAEGAHLEPDRKYGYAYLQATRQILSSLSIKHHASNLHQPDERTASLTNPVEKSGEKETPSGDGNVYQYNDSEWLDLLNKSIGQKVVNGIEFPVFPASDVQVRFVGSSYKHALEEASEFYQFLEQTAEEHDRKINRNSKILDFGCGWGRFIRFFMRDVAPQGIFGADVMPLAARICKETGLPGQFDLLEKDGRLPYADASFDILMAYSVFTHLPEATNLHWMRELARVAKPGAIFCLTLEPRFFLDRIKNANQEPDNVFLQTVARTVPDIDALYEKYDRGEIIFLPSGGGDNLTPDVYGDAIVPLQFIQANWGEHFELISYTDFPDKIWHQARLAVRRKG